MDLNTIASILRNQAATGSKIKLDESVFADASVRDSIRSSFALDTDLEISVAAADIDDPAADGTLTIAKAKASVLMQTELPVRVIFTAPNGTPQAIVSFELPSGWTFSDSFKALDVNPFKLLALSGAHFVYTTVAQPQFAWPSGQSTIDLSRGLNFLANVTFQKLPAVLNLLKPVIGEVDLSLKMWGPFAPGKGDDLPILKLRAPVLSDKSLVVGVAPFTLTLSNPVIAVQIEKATEDLAPRVDLLVEARFQDRLTVSIAIPSTDAALEISARPLPNFATIDDLIGALPGGAVFTDFSTHLPTELKSVFRNVALDNFALIVSPERSVTYIGMSVGTANPWTIISGVLVLEKLQLDVQKIRPATLDWTRMHLEAVAEFLPDLFPGKLNFLVELERETTWKVATISGSYNGSVSLGALAGKLIGNESAVPRAMKDIKFSDFGVRAFKEGDVYNYSFYGSAEASFPILGHTFSSALNVVVTKVGTRHDVSLVGGVVIGAQVFSISLKVGQTAAKLEATWENAGTPFGFGHIANAFGWEMPPMPEGLDLGLTDAKFFYDFREESLTLIANSVNYGQIVFAALRKDETRTYLFALDVPVDLKFSKLPVVGESLSADTPVGVDQLQIAVASAALDDQRLTAFNDLLKTLPKGKPLIPQSLNKGLTIAAKVQIGGPHNVVLPLTGSTPPHSAALEAVVPGDGNGSLAAADYAADAKWFNLQKTVGPVRFDKVGVQYQSGTLRFLLNAALSAAGLTLSVDGLSFGSSLKSFEPSFDVRGLGIEYKNEAVEIGGAFLRKGEAQYDGAAVIKTKQMTISALGSYTKLKNEPSLFIYAFVDYPLGGPAFFFVTGLAAGFGYNRRLIAPSIDEVAKFPLITQAVDGKASAPANVMEALTSLQTYVPPNIGSIFLAAGVRFNSFKLVDSFALLTMEFGNNFAVNLLGLSTAIVPTPTGGKPVTPLAQVQIAWKATFDPDDGCLAIDARLTPNSYILSKDCRLRGGYAFYSWFSGKHAGDFVQTLGGYHPDFEVPAHYPKVPRLAFDWRVSNSLTIQGDAYYALTGSALMAGGHLEVLFKEGELRAWLKLGADFLISWKPYHYDARMYVNVGASYTFDIDLLFGHIRTTISVDVGAQLHLWGPDFSGTASIDLSVISFTISFGAGASQKPPPLKEWATFEKSFLPEDNVCSISVKDGLVRKIEKAKEERWVINPKELSLVVDSAIPFKSAKSAADTGKDLVTRPVEFGVGPMNVSTANLTSSMKVTVERDGVVDSSFSYSVVRKKVPAGLWGQNVDPSVNGDSFIDNIPAGIEITPGKQPDAGATATIDLGFFQYSDAYYPKGKEKADGHAYAWGPETAFTPNGEEPPDRRKTIGKTIASNQKRDVLLRDLGLTLVVNIGPGVADDFISAPQIGSFTSSV